MLSDVWMRYHGMRYVCGAPDLRFFSARLITCGSNVGMCTEYDGRLRDYQGGISGFYIYSLETHFSHLYIIWT